MTIVAHKQNAKIGSSRFQQVTKEAPTVNQGPRSHHGIHEFRWIETKAGGTAICTCGRWELYGTRPGALTKESAKRNHALHLGMVADRAVGHEGALQNETHSRPSSYHQKASSVPKRGVSEMRQFSGRHRLLSIDEAARSTGDTPGQGPATLGASGGPVGGQFRPISGQIGTRGGNREA